MSPLAVFVATLVVFGAAHEVRVRRIKRKALLDLLEARATAAVYFSVLVRHGHAEEGCQK